MDETYVKVGGKDRYLFRAVGKKDMTVDFLLTKHKQKMSAQNFLNKAIGNNDDPRVVNIDKSGSNKSAIPAVNKRSLRFKKIKIRQFKDLNNLVYHDHQRVKRRIVIYTDFK